MRPLRNRNCEKTSEDTKPSYDKIRANDEKGKYCCVHSPQCWFKTGRVKWTLGGFFFAAWRHDYIITNTRCVWERVYFPSVIVKVFCSCSGLCSVLFSESACPQLFSPLDKEKQLAKGFLPRQGSWRGHHVHVYQKHSGRGTVCLCLCR